MKDAKESLGVDTKMDKLPDSPLKKYSELFEIAYRSAIIGGMLIWFFYFAMQVGVLPDTDGIEIVSYLIIMFVSSVIITSIFFTIIFFTLLMTALIPSTRGVFSAKEKKYILSSQFVSTIILFIAVSSCAQHYQTLNVNIATFIYVIVSSFIIKFIFIINNNSYKEILVDTLIIFFIHVLSTFSCLWLVAYFSIDSSIKISNWIIFISIASTVYLPVIVSIESTTIQSVDFSKLAFSSFVAVLLISIVSILTGKDNPFIVKPFEMFKLGNYYAKIKIEDRYAEDSGILATYNSTDNNLTNPMTIFVLSSVGSEYIFKKDRNKSTIFRIPKNKIEYATID